MNEKNQTDPYEDLANGIILQAVRDYRSSGRKLARGRKNEEAQRMHHECLRFFRSRWFATLTDIDPDYLIQKLDEEVKHHDC